MLNTLELKYLRTYCELQDRFDGVMLLGGSLNLKIRGLITRACNDLDLIVNQKEFSLNDSVEYRENCIYDLSEEGGDLESYMNRIGRFVPKACSEMSDACVFYKEGITYDDADAVVLYGKTILLQKIEDILHAKKYYSEKALTEDSRKKHFNDIMQIKLKQFITQ